MVLNLKEKSVLHLSDNFYGLLLVIDLNNCAKLTEEEETRKWTKQVVNQWIVKERE